jgi:hypothetical protein
MMKNTILATAAFAALSICFANTLSAQAKVTWKGGTPGQPNAWNCPKNWSNHRVPDEFSDVVIPEVSSTTLAAPVIKSGQFEVNSIQLQPNAQLTIGAGAQLLVYSIGNGLEKGEGLRLKGSLLILENAIVGTLATGFAQQQNAARQ